MSESTLHIIAEKEADKQAEKQKGPGSIPDYKYLDSFWATVTTAEWKLYYQETGQPIRMFLVVFKFLSEYFPSAWATLMRLFS